MTETLTLHEYALSGNCYKIRLTAAHVGVVLERRQYDILTGETRTPAFLATINPDGRIPVLQVGDRYLPESNAACLYLADGTALVPRDRWQRAQMMRWLFWEQYSHEPNIATLRFWLAFVGRENLSPTQTALINGKFIAGCGALQLMDRELARHPWIAGDTLTLADLVLYAYTHLSEEGGFDLSDYPHVAAWLARVAAHPAHIVI